MTCSTAGGIEEILDGIVVGGSSDDYEVGITVCGFCIQCRCQIQLFFSEILFDIVVLIRRNALVDHLHFFGDDVYDHHRMVLAQQSRYA